MLSRWAEERHMSHRPRAFTFLAVACAVVCVTINAHGSGVRAGSVAQEATSELAAARAAVGSPAALAELKALALKGTIQNLNHNAGKLGPEERLEIRILLPDNYLRIIQGSRVLRTYGFSGTTVLQSVRPIAPGPFTVRSDPGSGALDAERATLARLMLGMLAHAATVLRVAVRIATTPDGARALEARGTNGFVAWLDLAPGSQVPLQVRFDDEVSFPVEGGTERNLGYARVASMPPRVNAQVTLMFEDRRLVAGLRLPHRIRRVARGVTFEEMRLEEVVVNPPLTAKDFVRP
jgi:hypothetical protein